MSPEGLRLRPREHPLYSFGRLGAFLDGIYAIAATLLVVELNVPEVAPGHLGEALSELGVEYLVYAVAFAQIMGGWLVSRRIEKLLRGIDHYATVLFLFGNSAYALLPFTVHLISTSLHNSDDLRLAVQASAGIALGSMLVFSFLVNYIERTGLIRDDIDVEVARLAIRVSKWIFLFPALALIISFISSIAALILLGIFAVLPLFPFELHVDQEGEPQRAAPE